jgi:lysophospholipid acyltransferase (LPLAT)-like uncharacterized protein
VRWRPRPGTAVAVAAPLIGLLARTWRVDVRHETRWSDLVAARTPFVFLLWHEMLLPLLWRHRGQGVAIVVSEARDGRYLAGLADRLGYRNLLGSSSRGGMRVLLQAVRTVAAGVPVAFTPDGPRGPRREMKPGALLAAQRGGAVVLPIVAAARPAWRLRSWDRFMVPAPGARVRVAYGTPFAVGPGPDGLAAGAAAAGQALGELEREVAWPDAAATPIV